MKYERKEKMMIDKIFHKNKLKNQPLKNNHSKNVSENNLSKPINHTKKNPFKIEKIIEEPFQEDNEINLNKKLFFETEKDFIEIKE